MRVSVFLRVSVGHFIPGIETLFPLNRSLGGSRACLDGFSEYDTLFPTGIRTPDGPAFS